MTGGNDLAKLMALFSQGSGGIIADLKPYAGYFYSDLSQDEVEKWGELMKHVPAEVSFLTSI